MTRGHKNSLRDLTQEYLKSILHYDPLTGIFTWVVTLSKRNSAGKTAGSKKEKGRIKIGIDGHEYMAHRLAWLYMTGEWPEHEVDHRDEDQANNRWENLRDATPSQNHRNRGRQKNNKSGYKGVCFDNSKKKWLATINIKAGNRKKHIHVGHFATAEDAYAAWCEAAIKIHGKEWVHL